MNERGRRNATDVWEREERGRGGGRREGEREREEGERVEVSTATTERLFSPGGLEENV